MTTPWGEPYTRPIQVSSTTIGGGHPVVLLAGPLAVDDAAPALAKKLHDLASRCELPFIFATSVAGGEDDRPRFAEGLSILREIRGRLRVPVAVEVAKTEQAGAAAEVVDLIQIPSTKCQDIDLILEAARTGKPVNIKIGPLLSSEDAVRLLERATSAGNWNVILSEQGRDFGEGRRAVDFREFLVMRESGFPLIFEATESSYPTSAPSARSEQPRSFSPALALAGIAVGVDGLMLQVEDEPRAGSPSCTMDRLPELLRRIRLIEGSTKETL